MGQTRSLNRDSIIMESTTDKLFELTDDEKKHIWPYGPKVNDIPIREGIDQPMVTTLAFTYDGKLQSGCDNFPALLRYVRYRNFNDTIHVWSENGVPHSREEYRAALHIESYSNAWRYFGLVETEDYSFASYLKRMVNGKIPENGLVEVGYESRKDLEKDQNFKCVVMKDGQPFSNDEITSLCQTKRKEIREKFNLAKTNIGTYYDDDSSREIV